VLAGRLPVLLLKSREAANRLLLRGLKPLLGGLPRLLFKFKPQLSRSDPLPLPLLRPPAAVLLGRAAPAVCGRGLLLLLSL
jgi:hypothetical protein